MVRLTDIIIRRIDFCEILSVNIILLVNLTILSFLMIERYITFEFDEISNILSISKKHAIHERI